MNVDISTLDRYLRTKPGLHAEYYTDVGENKKKKKYDVTVMYYIDDFATVQHRKRRPCERLSRRRDEDDDDDVGISPWHAISPGLRHETETIRSARWRETNFLLYTGKKN